VDSAIWSILREAASRGPSAIADILVDVHRCERLSISVTDVGWCCVDVLCYTARLYQCKSRPR